jgi:hypothetical protein
METGREVAISYTISGDAAPSSAARTGSLRWETRSSTAPDLPSLLPAAGQAPGTVRILRLSGPALMPRRGDIAQTYRGPAGTGRMGDADGSAGPVGTRSRAGIHDGFCSPAAVSRDPGTMVAGSARTRSSRAAPAISGVSGSPSCFSYSSSVWPPRAAYARIPRLPTSPNGVIRGITAVTVMPSPARRD